MLRFCLLVSLLILWTSFSYAEDFLTVNYSAKAGDSLKNIVLSFIKEGVPPVKANSSLVTTMKKNPDIKAWNPLKNDSVFKLYLDPTIVNQKRFDDYFASVKKGIEHSLALSTIPTIGYFEQSNPQGISVNYTQISLLNLGMNYFYRPNYTEFGLSSGLYYATIVETKNELSTETATVEIPADYGFNVYADYLPKNSQFSYFGGIDFESFSTFHLATIPTVEEIEIDSNKIIYITAGLNYRPGFLEDALLRFSLSNSMVSNYSSTSTSTEEVKISGIKFIIYADYQFSESWSLSGHIKGQRFNGDNELSVNRLGLGLTYKLF